MNIIESINLINNGEETKKSVAGKLDLTVYAFDKKVKEEGYTWYKESKKFLPEWIKETDDDDEKHFDVVIKDGIMDKIKNEDNNDINKEMDDEMDIGNNENKTEDKTETKTEIKTENNLSMTSLLESIGAKEKQYKPVTVHLREDIADTLDSLVKGKGKGAKQELVNGLLEMVLKANNYL